MKDSIAKGVSNLTLILYSSGSGTMGVNGVIFGAWVLFFYNQVLGLSAVLASLAIGISLIFDAISDAVKDESPMQLIIFFGIGFDTALIVFSLFKLDIRFLKVIK